jgi:hypothetical protein
MRTPTYRRFGGNILLAIAAALTAALVGATVSASTGAPSDDQTRDHCFSTADAAQAWISQGAPMPDCAKP